MDALQARNVRRIQRYLKNVKMFVELVEMEIAEHNLTGEPIDWQGIGNDSLGAIGSVTFIRDIGKQVHEALQARATD